MEWMLMPLRRYAEFSGRSQRKEYWMYILGLWLAVIVLSIIESILGLTGMVGGVYGPLVALVLLGTLIPNIAVAVRRLHDIDKSGWWLLISFVPLIGSLVLLYFFVTDGTPGPNQFGADPKNRGQVEAFS
jgi:uncharacterized membrane protein YhaH (DUF805 family)